MTSAEQRSGLTGLVELLHAVEDELLRANMDADVAIMRAEHLCVAKWKIERAIAFARPAMRHADYGPKPEPEPEPAMAKAASDRAARTEADQHSRLGRPKLNLHEPDALMTELPFTQAVEATVNHSTRPLGTADVQDRLQRAGVEFDYRTLCAALSYLWKRKRIVKLGHNRYLSLRADASDPAILAVSCPPAGMGGEKPTLAGATLVERMLGGQLEEEQ